MVLSLNWLAGILYRLTCAVERHTMDGRIEPAGKGSAKKVPLGLSFKCPNCLEELSHSWKLHVELFLS
jgi:hypothetical protein